MAGGKGGRGDGLVQPDRLARRPYAGGTEGCDDDSSITPVETSPLHMHWARLLPASVVRGGIPP